MPVTEAISQTPVVTDEHSSLTGTTRANLDRFLFVMFNCGISGCLVSAESSEINFLSSAASFHPYLEVWSHRIAGSHKVRSPANR